MTSFLQLSALIVATMLQVCFACTLPHYSGYDSWSTVNVVDDKVAIDRKILLDHTPNTDYKGIVIENNGILAFKYNVAEGILLRTEYIHIKDGGEMKIGDKACGYSGSLELELLGERNPGYNIPDFGDKFIGVGNGGKLSIFGEEKATWTRLTKTIPKIDPAGVYFNDSVTQEDDNLQGLLAYNFPPTKTDFSNVKATEFKFRVRSQNQFDKTVEKLETYLDGLSDEDIVVFAIRKSLMAPNETKDFTPVYEIMEAFLGLPRSKLRDLKFYDGYVAYKYQDVTREETSEYRLNGLHQRCSLTEFVEGIKVYMESYTRIKAHGRSYINLQVTNRALSEPTMEVKGANLNWKKGDKILIAPTNGFDQHEYASITEVVVEDKTYKIDLTAIYEHQCQDYKGVPICAEVALVNQNVVIRGETGGEDLYGGHLKVVKGFATCHLKNVEFELIGQQQPLGKCNIQP
ncbi:cell surface hyaluronidase CEMIP2-like [Argopecten irradians]|uniref:cell surface hyaluronidase CEMIP2-like n=1 Tax=Argopecten irradians TaxID=31199 RepID=UPI003711BD8F